MSFLKQLSISGFKSIRSMEDLELRNLNVFIGQNGAGKSNLLEFFRMLSFLRAGELGSYVLKEGGANAILHHGATQTPELRALLGIDIDAATSEQSQPPNYLRYSFELVPAADDTLIFADESIESQQRSAKGIESWPHRHRETSLLNLPPYESASSERFPGILESWQSYHFHDTSRNAALKQFCDVYDNHVLKRNGSNLAAFLYLLKSVQPDYYSRIRDTVRLVAPVFDDFVLEPNKLNDKIRLEWKERGSLDRFSAHLLSDGSLRFICLATLLLQPEPPPLMLIDEPELGLHPYAIQVLGSMLRSASLKNQILVATQSVLLLDQFDAADIIVVDRHDGQTVFQRLDAEDLESWLEDYSLGELWEKGVLGGRPGI